MGAASSSVSSSSALHPKKYDVFISFRGEDTRTNFTSHLYTALCEKGFRTYIDYELPRGDDIKHSLMQAIENSSIFVVVFSENYANSKWCLNELLKIIECKRDHKQLVIPVFYKVDPSHVRHQQGTYKDAFAKHERDCRHDQQILNKWKHALTEIANLSGWDSRACRDESEFIRDIVNNILQHMKLVGHATTSKVIVGMNENCDNIEMLLKEAQIIGIWGMGGIGKTTMARAVFTKLASQFEGCCFLENIREETERHGLRYLRDKLLLELLKEDYIYYNTHHAVESAFAVRRLGSKKVFVVLDDVNCLSQVHYFTTYYDCLGHGSRVIITTRNRHLLIRSKVDEIYEAKPLSYFKSLQLFNVNAFLKDRSEIGFEQLSRRAVDYARGIPLVLIVLGSFLHSRTSKEWNSALLRLDKTPDQYIQGVLKLSYDGLNDEEKEIFLDIACFLNGETEGNVTTLLDTCGFHASIGLRTLVDNGLITINRSFDLSHPEALG